MNEWLELARWCAGALLIVSGGLKLGRTRQLHYSLGALGFSARFVQSRFVGAVLMPLFPWIEIGVGLGGIVVSTRLFPLASVLLYGFFLVLVTRTVLARREAICDCFGGLGDDRVTARTVARNAFLLALALFGSWPAGAPAVTAATRWGAIPAGVLVGVPFLVAVLLIVLRPMLERRRATRTAARLRLRTVDGQEISLHSFAEPPSYLVFFSPTCRGCRKLVERFRWWPNATREGFDVQPVFMGEPSAFAGVEEYELLQPHAWYDHDRSVARAVGLEGLPGVVLIDAEHPLGSGWIAGGRDAEAYVVRPGFYEEILGE